MRVNCSDRLYTLMLSFFICGLPPSLQLSPELHSPRVSDALVPRVSANVHPARERSLCSTEQLLHHQSHGGLTLNRFVTSSHTNVLVKQDFQVHYMKQKTKHRLTQL